MYTVVDQLPNIFVTCADGFFGTPFIRFSVLHRISNFLSFIDLYVVEPCSAVSQVHLVNFSRASNYVRGECLALAVNICLFVRLSNVCIVTKQNSLSLLIPYDTAMLQSAAAILLLPALVDVNTSRWY